MNYKTFMSVDQLVKEDFKQVGESLVYEYDNYKIVITHKEKFLVQFYSGEVLLDQSYVTCLRLALLMANRWYKKEKK